MTASEPPWDVSPCAWWQTWRGLGEFFTVSEWESPAALEAYKNGAFFQETWPRVKTFLRDRPWAQSFHVLLDEKRKTLTGKDGKPHYAPG